MRLEQRKKELAAIGASVGANCRPCIEHHLPAGAEAGLSEAELADAVATARAVRAEAVELFRARVDKLLGLDAGDREPVAVTQTNAARELVALGASIGANSHQLLRTHVDAAVGSGLNAIQITAALKMAEYVQGRAAEMTAAAAARAVEEQESVPGRSA